MKGSMSEFELNLLRQRAQEAIQQKAQRGEFAYGLPAGLRWTEQGTIEIEPDRRIQEVDFPRFGRQCN
jgi:DNA invertase Pin-like site-specific DNA recombinase